MDMKTSTAKTKVTKPLPQDAEWQNLDRKSLAIPKYLHLISFRHASKQPLLSEYRKRTYNLPVWYKQPIFFTSISSSIQYQVSDIIILKDFIHVRGWAAWIKDLIKMRNHCLSAPSGASSMAEILEECTQCHENYIPKYP